MRQIGKLIFEAQLEMMKRFLRLGEFKFEGAEYAYFREETMNFVYGATKKILSQLVEEGLLGGCDCGANLRQGWQDCPKCAGSGYCNARPQMEMPAH